MFSILHKNEDGFEKVILQDDETLTRASIVPACAAMLQEFSVQKEGNTFNVIDSYQSQKEFNEAVMQAGFKGVKLSPFVCRLENGLYHFGDHNYTIQKNREGKHALHGLLYDCPFEVISSEADGEGASVTMQYQYQKEDPGYPFDYKCIVTWRLEKHNVLKVTTICTNNESEGLIPMQDGWHPYFDLKKKVDHLHLEFQSYELVEFDEMIPTGNLPSYGDFNSIKAIGDATFDNCFTLNLNTCQPMCVLRNLDENIQVEFHPTDSYSYLQIYIPPHRNSIAIENLSGAPNAFNNGLGVDTLESGQSKTYEMKYKITLLNHG